MPSSTINRPDSPPLAVSMGEPSGIGPEIILKSWVALSQRKYPVFFVVGDAWILSQTARKLGLNVPIHPISQAHEAGNIFPDALPVLEMDLTADFEFGKPSVKSAPLVVESIKKAVALCLAGDAAGLVTAPIQKSILYDAGFTCPGHTEYLAQLCGLQASDAVMMLVSKELRVVPLTIHMALTQVPEAITAELLEKTCQKIQAALIQDFAIKNPRIAVAGLNPHGGEDGAMGQEEQQIITPALGRLREQGLNISGPLPADTMFHAAARATYDAALCMYHDQALIPAKTLDFDGGVNVTLGLPLVRTSPDHGTALNIAGKNLASPNSMINALNLAAQIYGNRHV